MPVLLSVPLCASVRAADGLQQHIAGSWKAVSLTNFSGSTQSEPLGPKLEGRLSFDPQGYFSIILMRADLPKITSGNRQVQTPQESHSIATGLLFYYGRYAVDEQTRMVTIDIEGSSFANWDGRTQKRTLVLEGDRLTMKNQTTAVGGGSSDLVWRRLQ